VPWFIELARNTLRVIKQNIAIALGLKLIFIVLTIASAASLWMAIAADMGARVLLLDQPAGRGDTASGTSAIFRAAAVDNEDGTVRFLSLWPAISPDGFKQSDSCSNEEPGCIDGHGELRSEPPGGHLETLGAWRYAVAIRAALEEAGWLG
jgi:hypothetical protein